MVMRYQDVDHQTPPAQTDTQKPSGGPDFNTDQPNFGAAPAPAPESSEPAAPNFGTTPAPAPATEAPADGPNFGTQAPAPEQPADQPAGPNFGG
jgi:hypothetical protein